MEDLKGDAIFTPSFAPRVLTNTYIPQKVEGMNQGET